MKSGAGIYPTDYTLNPGDGKDIEVHVQSNQVGDFNVKGRIVYYFGEEKDKGEDCTLNLPIKVSPPPTPTATVPGFGGGIAIIGLLFMAIYIQKRF